MTRREAGVWLVADDTVDNAAGGTGFAGAVPCRTSEAAAIAAFLREAASGTGVFDLGRASEAVADVLGAAWVGPGARTIRKPRLAFEVGISADGLRQYRSPSFKPKLGRVQANFDRRTQPTGIWTSRGHLDIDPTCP